MKGLDPALRMRLDGLMNEDTMMDTYGDAAADEAYWDAYDDGRWDDDPSPYDGTYSEE